MMALSEYKKKPRLQTEDILFQAIQSRTAF